MANENVILKVGVEGTGEGETKIKSLKAQLKEMKNELLGLDEGSDRFKQLSKAAGELTDKIGDVNQKVNALSSDTRKLDALVGAGSAIAGGFQAASGAMALFGSDSKKVEESIKNIIAVQGVLNGVQQVSQFLTAKGIIQDKLAMIAMGAKAALLKVVTAAQWLWNAAVTANPIGLIIVGVAALGTGIYLLVKNIKSVIAVFSDWKNVALALLGPIGWILIYMNEMDKAEKALGTTRAQKSAEATAQSKKRVAELKAEHAEFKKTKELENETLEKRIEIQENIGESSYALRLQLAENNAAILKDEVETTRQILLTKQEEFRVKAELAGMTKDAYAATIGLDYAALVEQGTAMLDDMVLDVQVAESQITKIKKDEYAKRKEAEDVSIEAPEIIKPEFKNLQDIEISDSDLLAEELDLQLEIEEEHLSKRQQKLKDFYEQGKITAEEYYEYLGSSEAELASQVALQNLKKLESFDKYTKAVNDLTTTIFTLTNNLGKQDEASKKKRAERQFNIKKALDMAEAAIDGTKAVLSTFANTPGGLVIKGLAATAAGVFAAAKIAAIGSAKFDGGGTTASVGSVSNAGDSVENVGNTTPNNPIQSGSTFLNQEPQKVYVLESDITKTQGKVAAIEALASFG